MTAVLEKEPLLHIKVMETLPAFNAEVEIIIRTEDDITGLDPRRLLDQSAMIALTTKIADAMCVASLEIDGAEGV